MPCAVTDPISAVQWLLDWIADRRGGIAVRLINSFSVVAAHDDPRYLASLRSGGISLPDGTYVAFALRLLGRERQARRVRGPSYFPQVLEAGVRDGVRHFFLGTDEATLRDLEHRATALWPGLQVAGRYAPDFQPMSDALVDECAETVAAASPDCVWVALGTPKQDLVVARLAPLVDVPCVAVGAAFDFLAGVKAEAPRWVQRVGMEWLWRFGSEPTRLWRRYVLGNVRFLTLVLRHRAAR